MEYTRYNLRLTKEMDAKLKQLSEKKLLSKNALIRIALDEFLKQNKLMKGR